ncbi:MAG TPA: Wadjet anti-phage system protein JetA family protein [Verrucomicrobiae bacterium]|nr:Wadjet anti-phage system protein JetA family protein [Verrucomicrobiae bacterium]
MSVPLSTNLFREVHPDYFRVLSGPLARLYVDALDVLEREVSQRNQGLDHEEAIALIELIVEQHQDLVSETDESVAADQNTRERARAVFESLRKAGWLQEEERSDWQRLVFFDPNGIILLQAFRRIAFPEAAVFSDKLVNVCATLSRGGEINFDALQEEPWAQVESCVASLQTGLAELRGMQKSIERHTKQQLAATSLKENLALLYDHFAERIGRTCYAQLVHARLPTKLSETRRALEKLGENADLLTNMQSEVMRREPALTPESATARVRLRLNELEEMLHQIEPLADTIDKRTAEFARRSQARFHYLQETTSENRARVQTFFEAFNKHFSGWRVAEIDALNLELPGITLHDTRILGGLESLYVPRLRRAAGEIEPIEDEDASHADNALAQLESNLRDSLTVSRANHFIASLPGERGSRWSSDVLIRERIRNDEDIADLIACLLHARSSDARFEIEVPRRETDADTSEFDSKLQYRIERFTLVKK